MKKSIERATSLLAVTAAIAAGSTEVANAEIAPVPSPAQVKATNIANKLSHELYDADGNPTTVVKVPGILNGSVKLDVPEGDTTREITYPNPIILTESHSRTKTDKNGNLLNKSWVGIPATDGQGDIYITPMPIQLGEHNGETMSLDLVDGQNTVLNNADIHVESATAPNMPDELYGSYVDDGDSGKFPLPFASGMK